MDFLKKRLKKSSDASKDPSFKFKQSFNKLGNRLFGQMQNLARAIVLPIAVLPIAGLLLGIGGAFSVALAKYDSAKIDWLIKIFKVLKETGQVVFSNLGVIFAIAIAFGFAKASKGVAALSGFITFAVMASVTAVLFFPYVDDTTKKLFAGFDPWHLTYHDGVKLSFDDDLIKNSGLFSSVLGISNTFDTSVLGGIVVGAVVAYIHNRSYNIKMPRVFAFFAGERFVPILAVFLGLGFGLFFFFVWPALLLAFQGIGKGMGSAMNFDYGPDPKGLNQEFHPSVAGAFIAFFFGMMERLLIPTGLHHVQYTPFWYTAVGGTWIDENNKTITGAYSIFFDQFSSNYQGHLTQFAGTMFMSGRFAFMQYGYPLAALAMWKLARPENKKVVAGILGSAALTSFLTGITEPLLFSFLFVAPLCFVWHSIMAGISFMMAYCLNVVVGQGFAAGFIDFIFFGVLPEALGKQTGFYWIFVTGLIMAPAYYFGFKYIIKWRNYKTLGREDGEMATNIALQTVEASLDKTTKNAQKAISSLITGLGGKTNIIDFIAQGKDLVVTLNDPSIIGEGLIRLSGTKTIKKTEHQVIITYLDGADNIYQSMQAELQFSQSTASKQPRGNNERLEKIFTGLGGRNNVTVLDNCATRLRVTVLDANKVDENLLKQTGAVAVVKKGTGIQVIYGLEVANIKNDLLKIWKN